MEKKEKRLFLVDGDNELEFNIYSSVDEPNGNNSVSFERDALVASFCGVSAGARTGVYLRLPLDEGEVYEVKIREFEHVLSPKVRVYVVALDYARGFSEKIGRDLVDTVSF